MFHFTDGTARPQDTDPAFADLITFRPNEAAAQFIPDTPPADDSELFKPPPVEVAQPPPGRRDTPAAGPAARVKARVKGRQLYVRFQLVRRARVALIARRKGKVVARTRLKMMRRFGRRRRLGQDLRGVLARCRGRTANRARARREVIHGADLAYSTDRGVIDLDHTSVGHERVVEQSLFGGAHHLHRCADLGADAHPLVAGEASDALRPTRA